MLPRLQAEERLMFLNMITVGGSMQVDQSVYRSFVRSLEREADVDLPAVKATATDLAAIGITVEEEEVS